MSSTRYAAPGSAPSPERNLSRPGIRPIAVSLSVTAQTCRAYAPRHRKACLWLANLAANSQRVQLPWQRRGIADPLGSVGRITEEAMAAHLGLEPIEIYRALTGEEDADLERFTEAVEKFRAAFEKALPPLVRTRDTVIIESAFAVTSQPAKLGEVRGKWRGGKTEGFEREWLKNLDSTIWIDCPENSDEASFIRAIATALGISRGGKKTSQLREQIKRALGVGLISRIIIDEAHFVWPANLSEAKPTRAEFIRHLRDNLGVSALFITTEQFALSLELARQHNTRWAPGQFFGRRCQFTLNDSHTDGEITAIARLHSGDIAPDALTGLLAFARAEEGYLGSMVEAISLARIKKPDGRLEAVDIAISTKQQGTDARIVEIAKGAKRLRRGQFKSAMLTGRAA